MAYRYGERHQMMLFPQSIEEYILEDNPVRVYDAFVEALNLDELGIKIDTIRQGCPAYDPKAMLKLLVYSYSYGWRSSRKIERATHHDISFMWLTGGLKPDHKTIARFRSDNKKALANILKQCARLCIRLDLIAGNTLFVDGSKMRGNASLGNTWTREKCEKKLDQIEEHIKAIIAETEALDEAEANEPSLVKINKELKDQKVLRAKIANILDDIKETGKEKFNATDPDCCFVKGRQGTHAGYNAQIAVDDKHGLIVSSDVVNESTDINQFAKQVKNANDILEKPCETACADAGYAHYDELQEVVDNKIAVVVPSQKQAENRQPWPFAKENFVYDEKTDSYTCPAGNKIAFSNERPERKGKVYKPEKAKTCRVCSHYGQCTKSKHGREIFRYHNERFRDQLAACFKQPYSSAVYDKRKQKVELPFGHIKRNLGAGAFLMRGIDGTKAEMSLLSSCFNVARMITLIGTAGLIEKLSG